MTLMWAVHQAQAIFPEHGLNHKDMVVHYIGRNCTSGLHLDCLYQQSQFDICQNVQLHLIDAELACVCAACGLHTKQEDSGCITQGILPTQQRCYLRQLRSPVSVQGTEQSWSCCLHHFCCSISAACAGAQKELDQWPVFQELLFLLPCHNLHIHFISPDVPHSLDGWHRSSTWQQTCCTPEGSMESAAGTAKHAAGSSPAVAVASISDMHARLTDRDANSSHNHQTDPCLTAPPLGGSCVHQASVEQCEVAEQQLYADMSSSDMATLHVTFHKGSYHDLAADLKQQHGAAGLVFGANAGRLRYLRLPVLLSRH